jgi:preprotein translocase subunit SecA
METDYTPYRRATEEIDVLGVPLAKKSEANLRSTAAALRQRALAGANLDTLLAEVFALGRELAHRSLGLRPFEVQVMAGVALHRRRLVEMQTGEGKTLAAVLPVALRALTGQGVHVLTFNDYLARRDAAWMKPFYEAMGLTVGAVQEGMDAAARRAAYAADVTYATAKEAGFDFLRAGLARDEGERVQRSFHFAILDEADSILIDEARVPLVIAGARAAPEADPARIAAIVGGLAEGVDWAADENQRNVQLTDQGTDRVESLLKGGSLHAAGNERLLSEVNQALHVRALLHRDVDYIVRDGRIALVDELTGRVVADRRWPDGLQEALEAKEGLAIQPGGQILGSITLQHFLSHYPAIAGMTATAGPAAEELADLYGLRTVPIPPHRRCVRDDLPDLIFSHRAAKEAALIQEIAHTHEKGRPVLVGTSSVEESEGLAAALAGAGIPCRVLNAKNDEAEAEIVAEAGAWGAVTLSTNMAGRGTDIRLGGAVEAERDRVVALGGLYVIGTNRHESRRIDDQLRGRAGRQGDPGASRFFVSLEDPLMVRFGLNGLIPLKLRPPPQAAPIDHPVVRREVDRLQRIVEGQNQEIRATLARYSALVEKQRATLAAWRLAVLTDETEVHLFATRAPTRYAELLDRVGAKKLQAAERTVTLHQIDAVWTDHLAFVAGVREGIHLVGIGGMDPFQEFHKQVAPAFRTLDQQIEDRVIESLKTLEITDEGWVNADLRGPSSTWTYLINDRAVIELFRMLHGPGSMAASAAAGLMTWPLLLIWGLRRRWSKRPDINLGL